MHKSACGMLYSVYYSSLTVNDQQLYTGGLAGWCVYNKLTS